MPIIIKNRDAISRLGARLDRLVKADYAPLMQEGARILVEENAAGLERGEDWQGQPMPATQRERSVKLSQTKGDGPPLIPRYDQSRAEKLPQTSASWSERAPWRCAISWPGFRTKDGRSILRFHAEARNTPYPKRDIIGGVRPKAKQRFRTVAKTYVLALWRGR